MNIFEQFENNIPHILFYGYIDYDDIIKNIYNFYHENDKQKYILELDCVISKSIKHIREYIKLFSKQQLSCNISFKSVILFNAEYLTMDAQYSLRRIIEIYSNHTRFFIFTQNKDKLLQPIRSRFIQIYIPKKNIIKQSYIPYNTIKTIMYKSNTIEESIDDCLCNGIYGDQIIYWMKKKVSNYETLKYNYDKLKKQIKDEKWILFYLISFFRNNKE
jgi:DNA polymerase III delta prime subunit